MSSDLIKCVWTICDNSDYDDIMWDLIFEEDGIEDEFYDDQGAGLFVELEEILERLNYYD
jgi:hypothetical protein